MTTWFVRILGDLWCHELTCGTLLFRTVVAVDFFPFKLESALFLCYALIFSIPLILPAKSFPYVRIQ